MHLPVEFATIVTTPFREQIHRFRHVPSVDIVVLTISSAVTCCPSSTFLTSVAAEFIFVSVTFTYTDPTLDCVSKNVFVIGEGVFKKPQSL